MRNREKKEYCVVCENFFQREQDLEHGKYTVVPPPSSSEAKTEVVATTTPVPASVPAPVPAPAQLPESVPAPPPLAPAPTTPAPPPPSTPSDEIHEAGPTAFQFPAPPMTQPPSVPPSQNPASMVSPNIRASMIGSPYSSPSMGRSQRELHGRVSNSIILPPSLGMASQQILGKHLSEDFDVSLFFFYFLGVLPSIAQRFVLWRLKTLFVSFRIIIRCSPKIAKRSFYSPKCLFFFVLTL